MAASPAVRSSLAFVAAAVLACSATAGTAAVLERHGGAAPAAAATADRPLHADSGRTIRVLLSIQPREVVFTSEGPWDLLRVGSPAPLVTNAAAGEWRIERVGLRQRFIRSDGVATLPEPGVLRLRASRGRGVVKIGRIRYRGELLLYPTDSGVMVVNALPLEDYLAGVVPVEIGRTRTMGELAAVEAQAIAARSFAMARLRPGAAWDVRASTLDQVYGGVDAESTVSDRAVDNTRGLVLRYGGRLANAPYHSTCGGTTAEAPEVWRSRGEPYLQRVSDRIPGTTRDYCDASPRYRWTKALDAATLDAAVAKHLSAVQAVPPGGPGDVRRIRVASVTPSGRIGTLVITTSKREYAIRGNDARTVLREPGGAMLNSSYFSVHELPGGGVRLEGRGYGHGIGLCQWGAIGRARAGQDFRTILQAYFPGTTIGEAE